MSKEVVEIKRTAEYYLRRALENDRKGALFDALKLYRKAFENGIDSAEALLMASIAASRMGYTGLAGKYITEAMLRNCLEPECLCAIGFSLCAQRRMRDAQRILDLLPLTRGGETALRRLADHYYKCLRPASARYSARLDARTYLKNRNNLLQELGKPNISPIREFELLTYLDRYAKPDTVYSFLKLITAYKPERALLHAMSVSALRSGQKTENVTEGWQKILEADPDDIEVAELIAWAKKGDVSGKLSLFETKLPEESESAIERRLKTVIGEAEAENRRLTSSEKRLVFDVCHSGSYARHKEAIERILASDADERLRRLKYIIPLRSDLACPGYPVSAVGASNPYALKYMFLGFSALPGLTAYSLERLVWQGSFIGGICDYLRDTAGGFIEAELAQIIRVFMQNDCLRKMCMFHTDAAQATITALYCERLQPNIPLKRIMKYFEAPGRSVARAMKLAKNTLA